MKTKPPKQELQELAEWLDFIITDHMPAEPDEVIDNLNKIRVGMLQLADRIGKRSATGPRRRSAYR